MIEGRVERRAFGSVDDLGDDVVAAEELRKECLAAIRPERPRALEMQRIRRLRHRRNGENQAGCEHGDRCPDGELGHSDTSRVKRRVRHCAPASASGQWQKAVETQKL
jgi:hypothetical protein